MIDQLNKIKVRFLDVKDRINNFNEVSLGYDETLAIKEASRCLNCINHPCVDGCPINNRIPEFIFKIKENKINEAYEIICSNSLFPSICSRVCSSSMQCESKCIRGIKGEPISISALERFVCDNHSININNNTNRKDNIKIAIIGAGISGLSCGKRLSSFGYDVTIFESSNKAGGILTYGIPEFRLPNNIVDNEIEIIKKSGVKIFTNKRIENYEELFGKYDYIYISIGAGISNYMNIPGENNDDVYDASSFLMLVNTDRKKLVEKIKGRKVVVIGGGNVAIDVSRSAIRLKAKSVDILYRRSIREMPANKDELKQALEENVNFVEQTVVKEIFYNGKITSMKCVKTTLGQVDENGRRSPTEIQGSDYIMEADIIIEALGNSSDKSVLNGLLLDKNGNIIVDNNAMTSKKGVYAGGDVVTGPLTVINAIKAGMIAADSIHKNCTNNG